jgi:hypothetical protein
MDNPSLFGAEQLAAGELPALWHFHSHGPKPVTEEAVPSAHKFTVGAVATATPLAEPHTPGSGFAHSLN